MTDDTKRKVKPQTRIFAHRGASATAPENTMAAFEEAVRQGADGIECDVHLSADGVPVICHDERVDRTTDGTGLLFERTLEELRSLDAGVKFSDRFRGERIPTLDEVLQLAKTHGLYVNLELKSGVVLYPELERIVAERVRAAGVADQVIVSSFNHYSLMEWRRRAPEVPIGLLYVGALVDPWLYAEQVGAAALHPAHVAVAAGWVQGAHLHGVKVHPWTVDRTEDLRRMLDAGVDAIITNYPDRLAEMVKTTCD